MVGCCFYMVNSASLTGRKMREVRTCKMQNAGSAGSLDIAEMLLTVLSTAWAYVVIPAGNNNAIHSSHCCRLRIALAWAEALACIAELLMTASSMAWAFA